jgi:hypothetical protein
LKLNGIGPPVRNDSRVLERGLLYFAELKVRIEQNTVILLESFELSNKGFRSKTLLSSLTGVPCGLFSKALKWYNKEKFALIVY